MLSLKRNYFKYVGELPQDIMEEIKNAIDRVFYYFEIPKSSNGKNIAVCIYNSVNTILETDIIPNNYEDIDDVSVDLGVMFGYALCEGYGWEWKALGDSEENSAFCVVSPKCNYSIEPMPYIRRILYKKNLNSNQENDNTILLLYNMLENIDQKKSPTKYYPIS